MKILFEWKKFFGFIANNKIKMTLSVMFQLKEIIFF